MDYDEFTARNAMLIAEDVQDEMKDKKILLCGCGIGSYAAEALLRMGCLNLTLVDMDTVSISNLNRQNYTQNDVADFKVMGLKRRLEAICPSASITAIAEPLTENNVNALVSNAEIIIDTIDYVDIKAILFLHHEIKQQKKPLISAMNIGFGAGLFYFPPSHEHSFESYLRNKMGPSLDDALYQQAFVVVLEALLPFFDQDVQEMLLIVAKKLQEGYPCPASQVAAGSLCCGSLVATCVEHIVRGAIITPFPKFHYINLHRTLENIAEPIIK